MVPRVIWKGSVSFGFVTIPVQLYSAVSRKNVRFNQLDAQTGARVRHKRVSSFVMRSKQYLAAIRPVDGRLMLSTMVYADELVVPDEIDGLDRLDDLAVDERETAMARQLIAALEADFEPDRYTDSYREAVLELIERKASGETASTVAAQAPASDTVVDLMAALEASVAAAKEARKRHPATAGKDAANAADPAVDADAEQEEPAGEIRKSA